MAQPKHRRHGNGQQQGGDQEHGSRFRFCRFVACCEEHHNVGEREAAAYQGFARERTNNVEQMKEDDKERGLHGNSGHGANEYGAR